MLSKSNVIIALVDENEKLIGFTRRLTDFVYRAIIFDVIIKPTHRNMKLGSKLMDAVVNHPQLKSILVDCSLLFARNDSILSTLGFYI